MYLNVFLGTLEMQWMLVSSMRKVVLPHDKWSRARMFDKFLSTTSHHCYLGNKYLFHAHSFCILAWISKYAFCGSCNVLLRKFFIAYESKLRWCIQWGVYKIMFTIHQSQICLFSNLLHINSSMCSHVQYCWNCNESFLFWYLLPCLKISQLALVPLVLVVMFLRFSPFVGVHWYTIRYKMWAAKREYSWGSRFFVDSINGFVPSHCAGLY